MINCTMFKIQVSNFVIANLYELPWWMFWDVLPGTAETYKSLGDVTWIGAYLSWGYVYGSILAGEKCLFLYRKSASAIEYELSQSK
jgi:hypothetical protein